MGKQRKEIRRRLHLLSPIGFGNHQAFLPLLQQLHGWRYNGSIVPDGVLQTFCESKLRGSSTVCDESSVVGGRILPVWDFQK